MMAGQTRRQEMKKRVLLKAILFSAFMATPVAALAAEHGHHETTDGAGKNALVEEMRALDAVFREVVSAVAVGDGARVHRALESMHGKMEKTQEALHKGEAVLRKNADKAAEFEKMDRDFHERLATLGRAAERGDVASMTAVTKKLLSSCVACHERFKP